MAPSDGKDDQNDVPESTGDGLGDAYVISRALAQATVDYLATRPYREVFTLIRGFEALEPTTGTGPSRSKMP
jgi:hypothetical protein